ncbi:unnamed protein product [Brassicogethes aeneus]|uniref:BZIP domain-containing protein n=1 Tax=Brassicogethes aeneus TaxID=1431903 RepID=A0A9P0B2I7_BRAAE|nr:unnamed protein product [Brassicogethes aeneus]
MSKRCRYVSDMSSSEDDYDGDYNPNNSQKENSDHGNTSRKPTRQPKVFSRNALMARENRLKKKMYVMTLENDLSKAKGENKKLSTIVDNQSFLIADLKKQVKHLKSVLANSSDLSNLIKNIHQSTGMSVSSSLDKNLKNTCVSKPKQPIARKTAHPWEESKQYPSFPTPESINENSPLADCGFSNDFSMDLLNCDIPLDLNLLDDIDPLTKLYDEPFSEHNYTQKKNLTEEDDIGVCLHVSKHRVSLEFCSSCSENASESWI